uniref:Olfactory receptor 4D6-like n=1 Tax=Acanthochromis polyacanthus TaxID=80966 RepID=A0A3Q1EQQ6_9TELE
MDDKFNTTYITFDGYVQIHKYRYLYFLMTLTVYVLIICSNSTIVYLIWIHQNLHEPMYIFIAALSMNSFLFSTAIYPKLFIDVLSKKQVISYAACLFQYLMYYALGGSDFLLLAAMAYDRYVSICKPLQYITVMKKRTIVFFLFYAWFLPGCHIGGALALALALGGKKQLCSFTLKGIFCNNLIQKLHCVTSIAVPIYGVFVFLNIVILPVLFILFSYTKILTVSYRSSGDVRRKAVETCLPHLIVLISFSCLCAFDFIMAEVKYDFPKTVRLIMNLQVVVYIKLKEISKHIKKMPSRIL